MAKVKRTYRLEEESVEALQRAADKEGVSATCVLEKAIAAYGESPAAAASDGVDWRALYFEEKSKNDEMSDRLLALAGKVADSLQASQALNAMDKKPVLESPSQKEERRTRWQRLREAWRG